jgi:hypothetical protein
VSELLAPLFLRAVKSTSLRYWDGADHGWRSHE